MADGHLHYVLAAANGLVPGRGCRSARHPTAGNIMMLCLQGAATQVYLCTSPSIQGGEYYQNCAISPASAASHDAELGSKLWALSEELVWAVPFRAPAGQLCGTSVPGSSESEQHEHLYNDLI